MAALVVDDVIRIAATWDIPDGTIAQLVYHYIMTEGGPISSAAVILQVIAKLVAAWDDIEADISDLYTGSTISLAVYDFVLHQFDGADVNPLAGADGTDVGDPLPHGDAGLVKIFTESARRQARKYVPGLVEDVVTAGTISAPALVNLALFGSQLDDDVITGGATLKFGTFSQDEASPLYETFSLGIGSAASEGIVAYQRRRRPGTGI